MGFLNKYKTPNYVIELESTYPFAEFINVYLDDNDSIRRADLYLKDVFEHNLIIRGIQVYYLEPLGEKRFFYKILAQRNNLRVKTPKDLENILDELLVNASLKNI
jgi:hypothetical protein